MDSSSGREAWVLTARLGRHTSFTCPRVQRRKNKEYQPVAEQTGQKGQKREKERAVEKWLPTKKKRKKEKKKETDR